MTVLKDPILSEMLRKFNLGNSFISNLQPFYTNAEMKLNVNGHRSQPILLKRGTCPLSTVIFASFIELLGMIISFIEALPRILFQE